MRLLIPVLFIINFLSAQEKNLNILSKNLHPDSAKKDFILLKSLFDKFHPGEFQHTQQTEFDTEFQNLYTGIQTELSLYDYYKITQELSVIIRDGHTFADGSAIIEFIKKRQVLPFNITTVDSEFYINKPVSDTLQNLTGKKLIAINSVNISEIIKNVTRYMEREGRNESGFKRKYQIFPYYYFLTDTATRFVIEYSDSTKQVFRKLIQGITYSDFLKQTRVIVEPASFSIDKDKIGILHVNTFAISDYEFREINYKKYFNKIFKDCRKENITRLIIDVRGNGGGNAELSNYLFSYLKKGNSYFYFKEICKKYDKPGYLSRYCITPNNLQNTDTLYSLRKQGLYCEVYKERHSYWWFKKQKPQKKPFNGSVVILMDGGSFSTTGHFIALIKNYSIGELIGDYSQGSCYSNDGGQYFQLPYSKIQVRIPTAQFRMDVNNFVYDSKGIKPDKIILQNLRDIVAKTDIQMEEAKRYLLAR